MGPSSVLSDRHRYTLLKLACAPRRFAGRVDVDATGTRKKM